MRRLPRRKPFARIVVTPLVDVVLVLLVLFLVLTPLLARSLEVRQPHRTVEVSEGVTLPPEQLVVRALPGGLFLNEEAVSPEALPDLLRARLQARSTPVVFFQGHPELRYADAIRYLDLIRSSGAAILGIAPELEVVKPEPAAADEEPR